MRKAASGRVEGAGPSNCPLCGNEPPRLAQAGLGLDVYRCASCRLDAAVHACLPGAAGHNDHFRSIDRTAYDRSVRATRESSYPDLLAQIRKRVPGGRWLDVGCSFGWLLERVDSAGYVGFGIDPSLAAVAEARRGGRYRVAAGAFPSALGPGVRFDVVSLMDVLEHLVDPLSAARAVRAVLSPNGILVVQVPDRTCLLYVCAATMARVSGGRLGFALRRLWLAGFDFPHQWYFTSRALRTLLERAGFEVLSFRRTAIGSPRQAIDRVRYSGSGRVLADAVLAAGVAVLNFVDAMLGHGGLMEAVARPRPGFLDPANGSKGAGRG
jgi:SAM-dependent methyltransferase